MNRKFEVGDWVKIIGNTCYADIGDQGVVTRVGDCSDYVFVELGESDAWWISKSDLEIIQKNKEIDTSEFTQPENKNSITHTITIENQTINLTNAGLNKLKLMITGVTNA